MSTPDQPSPPLTRRQLRELRNTASTPIITSEEAEAAAEEAAKTTAPSAPLPRAAEPVQLPEAPDPDVDLDEHPFTRRRARQQAKLRTASIDVIPAGSDEAPAPADVEPDAEIEDASRENESPVAGEGIVEQDAETEPPGDEAEPVEAEPDAEPEAFEPEEGEPEEAEPVESEPAESDPEVVDEPDAEVEPDTEPENGDAEFEQGDAESEADTAESTQDDAESDGGAALEEDVLIEDDAEEHADAESRTDTELEREDAPVVAPALGAQLLEGGAADVELPPSFDQLLTRGGSGSSSAPNALILSQTPDTDSLSVPILGTGELIITGSYNLPENYGSTGTAPGTSDGKDIDAALIDGELPPASSPTPIAASSAISTIKSADEIIRPPAPEKGSRLIMTLAICAGALGLALATVLILAVTNGVF